MCLWHISNDSPFCLIDLIMKAESKNHWGFFFFLYLSLAVATYCIKLKQNQWLLLLSSNLLAAAKKKPSEEETA